MAGHRVIVDGYNLIHKMPELAALVDLDLEHARDRLVTLLAGYAAARGVKVTVVFDGRGGQAGVPKPLVGGVEVIYSRSPQDADQRIKAMIAGEKNPKSCTVVTSDNSIINHVRDYRAKTVSSAEFARVLASGGGRSAVSGRRSAEKPEMKPGDVADWLDYFKKGGQGRSKTGR
jgi:predicted RNA-binding protein with PIN domain